MYLHMSRTHHVSSFESRNTKGMHPPTVVWLQTLVSKPLLFILRSFMCAYKIPWYLPLLSVRSKLSGEATCGAAVACHHKKRKSYDHVNFGGYVQRIHSHSAKVLPSECARVLKNAALIVLHSKKGALRIPHTFGKQSKVATRRTLQSTHLLVPQFQVHCIRNASFHTTR